MRVQTPKCAHGAMIAASERRLDFFVVGVQKAGTTALHEMLSRRPDIQMASGKEVHFFDDETINWNEPDCDRLHSRFSWKPARVRGEATPITIYWPNALERLHAYNPNAKIIVALRHPAPAPSRTGAWSGSAATRRFRSRKQSVKAGSA